MKPPESDARKCGAKQHPALEDNQSLSFWSMEKTDLFLISCAVGLYYNVNNHLFATAYRPRLFSNFTSTAWLKCAILLRLKKILNNLIIETRWISSPDSRLENAQDKMVEIYSKFWCDSYTDVENCSSLICRDRNTCRHNTYIRFLH